MIKNILLTFSIIVNVILAFMLYNAFKHPVAHLNMVPVANERDAIDTTKKVVMLGNSITYQGNWPQLLNRTDVINWGVPGCTSGQMVWNIKNFLPNKPRICFIMCGRNDLSTGVPVPAILENVKLIIDSLQRNKIIPVVQSCIYLKDDAQGNIYTQSLNNLLELYCTEHNIDYLDLNLSLSPQGSLLEHFTTDGCHLTPDAYIPWAEEIKNVLKKHGI